MKQELDLRTIKKGPLLFIMILGAFIAVLNQTIMSVAIAGMNDAYFAVIIFGLIGLIISFFIKKTKQGNVNIV